MALSRARLASRAGGLYPRLILAPLTDPEGNFYNDAGTLVLLRLSATTLTRLAEAPIGHWSQGVAFSADGRTIVVGNMVERDLQVFELAGGTLRDTGIRIKVKGGAAAIRTADR